MEKIEYKTRDKSKWPEGEWQNEPDKVQWKDEKTGLPCLTVRNRSGAWCGYVGVAEGHPLFGVGYCDAPDAVQDAAHCGLTFSDFCADTEDESESICHLPAAGEPDRVWWLGFDCAHGGDLCPGFYPNEFTQQFGLHDGVYRNLEYTQARCTEMAAAMTAAV